MSNTLADAIAILLTTLSYLTQTSHNLKMDIWIKKFCVPILSKPMTHSSFSFVRWTESDQRKVQAHCVTTYDIFKKLYHFKKFNDDLQD